MSNSSIWKSILFHLYIRWTQTYYFKSFCLETVSSSKVTILLEAFKSFLQRQRRSNQFVSETQITSFLSAFRTFPVIRDIQFNFRIHGSPTVAREFLLYLKERRISIYTFSLQICLPDFNNANIFPIYLETIFSLTWKQFLLQFGIWNYLVTLH
jgi:hypothetical protein